MPSEKELDSLLIQQKNDILTYINNEEYDKALAILLVICGVWQACHYGYKYNELCNLMKERKSNASKV